jgi:hypothetical protein
LDEDLKALKIVMNVLICNSLMVCKRMIDEAFIPVTRRKRVFARKFENRFAVSARNV